MNSHDGEPLRVLSLPDWRGGNQYQTLLGEELLRFQVRVVYPQAGRAIFRIEKAIHETGAQLVHLHWPEAYLGGASPTRLQALRFLLDLKRSCRRVPLVYTAHNLLPHNSETNPRVLRCYRSVLKQATRIMVHSEPSLQEIERTFGIANLPAVCIPHGDLAAPLGKPLPRNVARQALELPDKPVCLMFGVVEPYKGIEEVISAWKNVSDATLLIVGRPYDSDYGRHLAQLAALVPNVRTEFRWVSDLEIRLWLSACDAVLFNYRRILTSGAASLVRSFGCPVLLPQRLTTIYLDEPHSHVIRFLDDFSDISGALRTAFDVGCDYDAAAAWRDMTSWDRVARAVAEVFHSAANERKC